MVNGDVFLLCRFWVGVTRVCEIGRSVSLKLGPGPVEVKALNFIVHGYPPILGRDALSIQGPRRPSPVSEKLAVDHVPVVIDEGLAGQDSFGLLGQPHHEVEVLVEDGEEGVHPLAHLLFPQHVVDRVLHVLRQGA